MEAQQFRHLSFMSTWIFVLFFPSICPGMDAPKIHMNRTVYVALKGEDCNIKCVLTVPANQSNDILTCSDPLHKQIYNISISATAGQPKKIQMKLELKNLKSSGEYSCQYKTAKVYWFLRVRNEGYKEPVILDYTEFIIVAIFTGVLLVFSVVGSVCVFRGHWKERITEGVNTRKERKEKETGNANIEAITAQSTSFYASLEPRPRSIYDVLDHSAANRSPDQSKAKPKKNQSKTMAETTQPQQEGVFEGVYENF